MSFVNLVSSELGGAVNPAQILWTHWTCIPERRPNVRWVVLEQRISFSLFHLILMKALWRTELVYINSLASLGRDSECPWMGPVRIVAGPKRLLGSISNHWVRIFRMRPRVCTLTRHLGGSCEGETGSPGWIYEVWHLSHEEICGKNPVLKIVEKWLFLCVCVEELRKLDSCRL